MIPNSLRVRLIVTWAIFIALALQVAGIGLRLLFERSITRRTELELRADVRQLRRGMEIGTDGSVVIVRPPTDPQFDLVLGGRYWQIAEGERVLLRSPSLDRETLIGATSAPGTRDGTRAWLVGPRQERLFAIVQDHAIGEGPIDQNSNAGAARPRLLRMIAAVDASEIGEDSDKFTSDLFTGLAGLAVLLLAGAWAQVSFGLKPLERLRSSVSDVRRGAAQTIAGEFPDEVMPLVAETNELLASQTNALTTARARAGDLAHGLKTPLAVMAAKGRQLKRKGEAEIAQDIQQQIDVMHRHVARELARARARGAVRSAIPAIDVASLLRELISVVQRLPRGQDLQWTCEMPDSLFAAVDADDFNNMAGNLIENAQKWAKTHVLVTAHPSQSNRSSGLVLIVEDDGPGVQEADIERVLKRGERADTSVSGSGLGLAIVSDLVEIYHGELKLARSKHGGLKVVVTLCRLQCKKNFSISAAAKIEDKIPQNKAHRRPDPPF